MKTMKMKFMRFAACTAFAAMAASAFAAGSPAREFELGEENSTIRGKQTNGEGPFGC
jgi:hypothetical protein